MPPKHQRYRWLFSASNVNGMMPWPYDPVDMQAGPAGSQHAQRKLGVLGQSAVT